MFDIHTIKEPAWITALIEDVVMPAITPFHFMGPLGYRWWEPTSIHNTFDGWQLAVYPTPSEVSGPCQYDGHMCVHGFQYDIGMVIKALGGEVEQVLWQSPTKHKQELDGPEVSIRGSFAGKHIWLRMFNIPPSDEPPTYRLNPATGEVSRCPVE